MFRIVRPEINYQILLRLMQCASIALAIVWVTNLFYKDFFFIDDAQNENLPFYKEMGRIWLSGHIPILTTNTFLGGNILVDMVLSPFAPQTILTSIVATQVDSFHLIADFLAWINITLVLAGSYWLGRILNIRPGYALLSGFIIATNPVFLYVFSASWWNLATAFAWFTVSFAALMQFRTNQRGWSFFVAVFSSCALFASAGTQIQLAYLLSFGVIAVFDYYQERNWLRLADFVLIGVCTLLISAIPMMAEYSCSNSLINRVSHFRNNGNLLVPAWGFVVNFFNPFYATYMHWFGGYRYFPLSLGYAGIMSLIPVFFLRNEHEKSINYKIILSILILSLLFSFTSSQFGALRFPFRFLSVWAMMVALLAMLHIEQSTVYLSKQKIYQFGGFVLFATLIQLFSADAQVFKWIRLLFALIFILLCMGLVAYVYLLKQNLTKQAVLLLWLISTCAWLGMLSQTHSLVGPYLSNPNLNDKISGLVPDNSSYILGLAQNEYDSKENIADIYSAQYLLFGLKSINGYSPVGHSGMEKLFPSPSSHGYFKPAETLKNISQPSEIDPKVFDYQLMNIGHIFAWKWDITQEVFDLIVKADFSMEPYPIGERVYIKPHHPNHAEGSLTYPIDGSVKLDHADGMTQEWFNVTDSEKERILIFSRVYWLGYHAVMNDKEFPVSAYKDLLVKVVLPAGVSGKLHFYYEPVSWMYTKWSLLLGLALFGVTLIKLHRKENQNNALKLSMPVEL